ncbi:hypothetical protein [Actinoplanes teichomyceticus]|uniref:Uncharacterized protein n=1 Tax=Actinoplanes teichomyceticus TaxID=1867 RepID=A0A561WK84_ACTTI|nr:hypothetical protein [Actinoplanes teichomyceticus]TWG24281.1 hypothetical protein FHX34_102834 [Actinoplanes teichomyceticus]GIF12873.1 hypothetical protein Ate01nite_29050 [Actinoplanes teichomyceticus]
MSTTTVAIREPVTGQVIDVCRGPTPAGVCPRAGRDGVVPCAGHLVGPPQGDARYWPVWVPPGCRQCRLNWNEQAAGCLREAERCRDRWHAGLVRETDRVYAQAAAGDPRFRRMSDRELRITALWRWRLSSRALALRRAERKQRDWSRLYLSLAEQQREAAPATAG